MDARFILMDDLSDGQELFPVRVYNDVNRLAIKPFKYTKNIIDMEGYVRTPCVSALSNAFTCIRWSSSESLSAPYEVIRPAAVSACKVLYPICSLV